MENDSRIGRARWRAQGGATASDPIYGLGLIGALVYYVSHASTFGAGALGVLKAIVWPAILVYEALTRLSA